MEERAGADAGVADAPLGLTPEERAHFFERGWIVKKGVMDLGTIRGKLATYATVDAFAADARRPARTNERTKKRTKKGNEERDLSLIHI